MGPDKPVQFILASASPRRRELLTKAGYVFEVIVSEIDESDFDPGRTSASQYARTAALAKAKAVAAGNPTMLVLGADTVVDCDGQIIGKPTDAKDAERITRLLFSRPHAVVTGVAVVRICDGTEIAEVDRTVVYPKLLSEKQIAEHIRNGSWEGKAGAYGIQEGADEFVERIEGSLSNVMGLLMKLTQYLLDKFGSKAEKE
ncbi:MAG: Maf family protein [Planctomycetota bacterium]